MKTIYPNEKVNLKKGGRSSDKITAKEFEALIRSIYEKLKKKEEEVEDYEWDDLSWAFYFNEYLPKLEKDLKYDFDFENIVKQGDIRFTTGGTPYLEFICGGDWEKGLLLYVYPSENMLRVYIPTKGNTVRKDLKCVFGSERELEAVDYIPGVGFPDADKSFLDYLRKYSTEEILDGESIETEINRDWCLEDFETRLGER